jgi:uncharacterized BrkB/YihY/UPF0761 family membrane protein
VPGGAIEVIRDQITRVASQGTTALGLTFLAGLAASLWSANAGIKSLFDALNLVYNEAEKRSFIWLNIISLMFTVLTIGFALVAMGAMVVVPIVLNSIGLGGATASDQGRPLARSVANAAPVRSPWMWTLAFGQHEDRSPTHGYAAASLRWSRSLSWRRE